MSEACVRHGFRVVHYSIQRNHVHLLIEAQTNYSIACGMKSVGARIGKLANRLFERKGKVLDGRYHLRPLRTPLEVHRALRYVLLNHRHHAAQRRKPNHSNEHIRVQPDPASSGRWFDGWRVTTVPPNAKDTLEVAPARTWLLQTGWRRHGLIDPEDVPVAPAGDARRRNPAYWPIESARTFMLETFLAELKRRKVLRVVGAYAVVSWGVLQVIDKLFPALMLPPWTITFVAVLLIIGLPITAIITWAFEITPDGIRRTASESEPGTARAGWLETALLVAIVVAVGISFVQLRERMAAPETATTASTSTAVQATAATTAANSIAVLPFTSFSEDAESNYFADGLTEELINELANIPGMKVSGRTSSFYFKNRNEDLREIGRTLGVSQVLEGSVRRSGDKLRITVQLISTSDGFHLWSQTYDRHLDDIFAIQDDVAMNVASVLEMKIGAPNREGTDAMHDMEDYRLYLIALALLHERALEPLTQARELFTQLKTREPDNADALAGYTQATMLLAGTYMTLDFETASKDAIAAVEHALEVDPNSVSANVAAGAAYTILLHRTDDERYRVQAERTLARAVELAPEDPDALATYGTLLNEMGNYESAYELLRRAATRDPLSRVAQAQLITSLEGLGRLAEAREKLITLGQMYPDYVFPQLELGELLLTQGQLDAALPYLQKAHASKTSPRATFSLALAYLNLGLEDEVRATLAQLEYSPLSVPFGEVILLNSRGDEAGSFRLAQAQLEKTGDPIWQSLLINSSLALGDLATARREITKLAPTLLATLDASHSQPEPALLVGELLTREGRKDDAARVFETLLTTQAPPAHGYDPAQHKVTRAKILARLGRSDAAIDELRAAQLQGNRLLWDFDFVQRLDRVPAFETIRDDPRFRAVISDMEAENRVMRDRVLKQSNAQNAPLTKEKRS